MPIKNKPKHHDRLAALRKHPDFAALKADLRMRLHFGVSVYRRRLSLKLSQTRLAEMIGSSQKVISLIENGAVDMQSSTMNRLQAALGFQAEDWASIYNFTLPACRVLISSRGANRFPAPALVRAGAGATEVNNL